jgi:hypothetical protein
LTSSPRLAPNGYGQFLEKHLAELRQRHPVAHVARVLLGRPGSSERGLAVARILVIEDDAWIAWTMADDLADRGRARSSVIRV